MPTAATLADLWTTPRRHPDRDDGSAARLRHVRAVALFESGHWTGEHVARLEGVSRKTLYQWRDKVLRQYDDPEAVALRRRLGVAEPDAV